MANNFIDSGKREHNVMGYEVRVYQYMKPFSNRWFARSCGNSYCMNATRVDIRHHYSNGNKTRWTAVYKYKHDTCYTVEVYDAIEVKGDFYDKHIFRGSAFTLREAIHMANIHKSDK